MKSRSRWLILVLGLCSSLSWAQGRPPRGDAMQAGMNRASLRDDIARFNADRAQGRSGWGAFPDERGDMRGRPSIQQERGMGRGRPGGGRHDSGE